MACIKYGLEDQIRIFVKSHFLGRYGSAVLQQQWENMIQEVPVFYVFFQNKLIFVVDKIPHSKGMTPYIGISKIWSTQLLSCDFDILWW